jgi:conjugal transfer pilus assembly protein TraL
MAADKYAIPSHLDDPEHILIGMAAAFAGWWGLKKAKAGRAASWLLHLAYWHLPAGFTGLRATPPSYLRLMAG